MPYWDEVRASAYPRLAIRGNADRTMHEANGNSGASGSALGPIKNSPGKRIMNETRVRPLRERPVDASGKSHLIKAN